MTEEIPSPVPQAIGDQIGTVMSFFAVPSVAIVKVAQGTLKVGDTIWIRGHTTDLKQAVTSMQVEHKPVAQATAGEEVGIQVSTRVRKNDQVYKVSS